MSQLIPLSCINIYHSHFIELKYSSFVQDVGVCYAFVEFEDMSGVRNAVKVEEALEKINIIIPVYEV